MFALVLIFQFLERFMPFGDFGFVNFNITLAFILLTASHLNYIWAFGLLLLRFVFGPLLSGSGYAPMSVIGQIILFVVGILVLGLFYLTNIRKAKFTKKKMMLSLGLVVLAASAIMPWLNAWVFTPWFLGASSTGGWTSLSLPEAKSSYEYIKDIAYFGIKNYWVGHFAVYFTFNMINLTITMLVTFPLLKIAKLLGNKN